MIKDLRNTFKQTAIYGLSNIFVKAAGLLLLPIYTSSLSLDAYGMLAMFELITQFFVGVISFSLPASMLRIASDTENRSTQNRIYFTAAVLLAGFCGLFLLIFLPLNGVFSSAIFDSDQYASYFTIAFVSIVLEIFSVLPMQLLRLREKSAHYLMFFSLKLIALIGFVWYFVVLKDMGVYGALWGVLLANATLLLATLPMQLRNIALKFDKKAAREMYAFGAPLIFTTIAGTILTIADRIIIEIYGQLSDLGIYTLAYKVGSLSNLLIIGTFALGFLPIAFKKFGDANFDRFFSKIFTYYMGLSIVLTMVVSLFSKEGIKIISSDNPDYWIAIVLVPFIAYVFLLKAIQTYLSYVFFLIKKTRFHAYVTIFGVIINVGLNFLFIPKYGMYGAILATGLSYIAMGIYTYRVAQKNYPVAYEFKRIAVLMISCAVFISVGIYFNYLGLLNRVLLKTVLVVGYGVFLYYGVADKVEREKIQKVIKLIRNGGIKAVIGSFNEK